MRLNATRLGSIASSRSFGDQLDDLAGQVPNLDLNFAQNKSLIDDYSGTNLVTFTRASSGTFVGSDGVIQTAVTNLLLQSEDFSTSWTTSTATVTTNVATAPNGTTTADLYSGTSTSAVNQSVSLTSGVAYTISFYVKSAGLGNNNFRLRIDGTQTSSNFTATSEWQRFTFTATSANTAARVCGIIRNTAADNVNILIWGAQLEQASTVGEYIPTTSTINSAPRFDHNPTTGESLGLLVEEARTNLITTSEALANITGASITNNTTTAPDGLVTADTLIEDTSTGSHSVNTASIIWAGNTAYTFTFFLKANTRTQATIAFGTSSNWVNGQRNATFDLSAGTVIATAGSSVTASIEPFLNSWYRCRLTATTVAVPVPSTVQTQMYVSGSTSYTGNGTSGLFFWGAQLEAGAFPTSYIPTTTATATRAADVASITGSAFTSFYNQTEGTLYLDNNQANITGTLRMVSANDNTSSNRINLTRSSSSGGNINLVVTNAGTNQVAGVILGSSLAVGTSNKVAAGYKAADFGGSVNGLTPVTQSTGTVPSSLTQLTIANGDALGTTPVNSTTKRLCYWNTRLPSTVLQAITQP